LSESSAAPSADRASEVVAFYCVVDRGPSKFLSASFGVFERNRGDCSALYADGLITGMGEILSCVEPSLTESAFVENW
jgi:hypothetical protein